MNKRIKELADEAQYYAEYTTPQGLEWLPAFKEKFAELIVRECIDILNKDDPHISKAPLLKEHFGVEE